MIPFETHSILAMAMALLWIVLACLAPLIRVPRRDMALVALVVCGVPVLGWVTYLCGPICGVLFLSVGLSLLVWPPLDALRRRRHHPQGPEAQ